MKRVGYLAGAGALVPIAIGMATPVAAQAAASHAAKSDSGLAKRVSVPGVTPDATCIANTSFTIPTNGNVGGHGFYNAGAATCVGTVDIRLKFNKTFSKSGFVTVGWSGSGVTRTGHVKIHGTAGGFASGAVTIRQSFVGRAEVCVHSTYQTKAACVNL